MIKITFRSCIKRSISKSVGCKLPWDKTTSGFDTCEDIHQFRYIPMRLDNSSSRFFRDFSKRYLALSYLVPGQLEEITGCRLPCAYKEFRFFGSPRVRSRNGIFLIKELYPEVPSGWFWPHTLEHLPLYHNRDRTVDIPLPFLGRLLSQL